MITKYCVKTFNNIKSKSILFLISVLVLAQVFLFTFTTPAYAHQSPSGCAGSGLGIDLFSNVSNAQIGDTILFSVIVFNGIGGSLIVCDATGITVSIVTPDGVSHPITLTRTTLTNGESDTYTDVVSYIAQADDFQPDNTLKASASVTGDIHQNVVNSQGGATQGLNIGVIDTQSVPEFGFFTGALTGLSSFGGYLLIRFRNKK